MYLCFLEWEYRSGFSFFQKVEAESERAVREAYGGDILPDMDDVYADDQALYEGNLVSF